MSRKLQEAEELLKNLGFDAGNAATTVSQEAGNEVDVEVSGQDHEVPEVPTVAVPEVSPDGHNWEKRKQDAQEAQRKLAEERRKLEQREANFQTRLDEFEARHERMMRELTEKATPAAPVKAEVIDDEFEREYPDLAKAVVDRAMKVAEPISRELAATKEQLERMERERAEEANKRKGNAIIAQVVKQIPDALQIAQSDGFKSWLGSLPSNLGKQYRDVIERTSLYSPADAVYVLNAYRKEANLTTEAPARQQVRDAAVAIRPTAPTPGNQETVRPLTPNELARIDSLVKNARTPEERQLWSKRLLYTYQSNNA